MIRHFRHPNRLAVLALVALSGCDKCTGPGTDPDPNNQDPSVTISSPVELARFSVYAPITFAASATDPEDGSLLVHWSLPQLTFNSPQQLGTGPTFAIDTAQVGELRLAAWVQDLNGGGANAIRKVFVVFGGEIAFDLNESSLYRSDGADTMTLPAGGKPAWSPNGQQIAFVRIDAQGDREIYVANADGTGTPVQVTNNTADDDTPAWSPDGLRLAYDSDSTGNREIFFKVLASGQVTRVTTHPAEDSEPAWCGTDILFQSNRDNNDFDIYKQGNLLSAAPQPITTNNVDDLDPHWSMDCTVIVFSHEEANGNLDVYTMNPDGTGSLNLTNHPANDRQPELSPGKLMAVFKSDRGGSEDLWFIKTLGPPQPRRWAMTISTAGHPRWRP